MGRAIGKTGEFSSVSKASPIVLFDGVCHFCNNSVQFLIRRDKNAVIQFAPLQSKQAKELITATGYTGEIPDGVALIEGKNIYFESDAALKSLYYLGGGWKIVSYLKLIPKPLRQSVYRMIARNRYKWFGKYDTCVIPKPEWKSRFIDQPIS